MAAYLAGLFDGEGCVSISRPYGYLRVSVVNTNRELCEVFHRAFGGSVSMTAPAGYRPGWKAQYQWIAQGRAATKAREHMGPYLREKQIPVKLKGWSDEEWRAFRGNQ